MIPFETAFLSLPGNRRNNQDRCAVIDHNNSRLLIVADGLGGHPKGEVAAQIAVNVCQQMFDRALKPIRNPAQFLSACVQYSHQAILEYGNRQHPAIQPRTTLVIALVQQEKCHWSHVGDSRFYLIRGGKIVSRSKDHSLRESVKRSPTSLLSTKEFNPNAITRCLGGDQLPPKSSNSPPTTLRAGDTIILSTDGFWKQLEEQDLIETLSGSSSLRRALHMLANEAAEQGYPNSDNVTATALHFPDSAGENPDSETEPGKT